MKNILLAIMFMSNICLADQNILSITNEEDGNVLLMSVQINKENKDIKSLKVDKFNEFGKKIETEIINPNKIVEDGITLKEHKGIDIIRLLSENFAHHQGGDLTLDTLYNGITKSRKSYDLEINRLGDKWEVNFEGKPAKKLHIKSKKAIFIGTIGIESIEAR